MTYQAEWSQILLEKQCVARKKEIWKCDLNFSFIIIIHSSVLLFWAATTRKQQTNMIMLMMTKVSFSLSLTFFSSIFSFSLFSSYAFFPSTCIHTSCHFVCCVTCDQTDSKYEESKETRDSVKFCSPYSFVFFYCAISHEKHLNVLRCKVPWWVRGRRRRMKMQNIILLVLCEIFFTSVKLSGDDDKRRWRWGEMMIKFSCSQKPSKRHDTMASFAPEEMKTLLRSPFLPWRWCAMALTTSTRHCCFDSRCVYVHEAKSNLITNNEC